jgi:N6-adenosine-specific RNA methylase IME4
MKNSSTTSATDQVAPNINTKLNKKFKVILADPPWDVSQKGRYGASRHYDTMTIQEICAMGEAIRSIAADDCWLLLWVTNKVDHEHAKQVLAAWGFDYRSKMTWFKCKNNGLGKPWRNSTEQLILASRGNPPYVFRNQATHLFAPTQDHSHKPEELYAVIDRFIGDTVKDGEKIELFARRPQHGWSVWGKEADSDITLARFGYPVPSDSKFDLGGQDQEACHES